VNVAIRGVRDPEAEIDCVAMIGEADPIRGFLRLPSTGTVGRLRLVDMPPAFDADEPLPDVTIHTLEQHDSVPGCLPSCFVRSQLMSMPVPAPFPLELGVNSAILGAEDPDESFESIGVLCQAATGFLDEGSASLEEVASAGALRIERIDVPFGDLRLQIFEIVERSVPSDVPEFTTTWSSELFLSGSARTIADWSQSGLSALALISFCLDRPLRPDLIYAVARSRRVELHRQWRETDAPENTSPLLTESKAKDRLSSVSETWCRLREDAGEFINNVVDYQLRRGAKTPWDGYLVAARCLELYFNHADRFASVRRPAADHTAVVTEVMGSLSEDLRLAEGAWIEAALQNANRTGFLDQVRAVLGSFGGEVLRFCGVPTDHDEFAKTVRDSRNYFTHHPSRRPARALDGRDLVVLQHRLWFVVRACILREMGFSEPEIVALLRETSRSYLHTG
jgi:hypothetical protein